MLPFEKVFLLFEENKGIFNTDLIPRLFRSYDVTRAFLYIAMPIHAQRTERFDEELFLYFLKHFEKHQNAYLEPYFKLVKNLSKEDAKKIDIEYGKNELEITQMTIEALKELVESKIDFKDDDKLKKKTLSDIYYQLGQIGLLLYLKEDDTKKLYTVIEYFKKALSYNKNNHRIFNAYGNALSFSAYSESNQNKKIIISEEAIEQYKKAIDLDQEYATAWYNWGNRLGELAKLEPDDSRKRELLKEEIEKYQKATECDPKDADAWHGLGCAIHMLSHLEQDADKKRELIKESIEKLNKTIECDPNDAFALSNLELAKEEYKKLEGSLDKS